VLNFEAVVLLSDRSFPTWQLRHSPPVGNSHRLRTTGLRGYTPKADEIKCRCFQYLRGLLKDMRQRFPENIKQHKFLTD